MPPKPSNGRAAWHLRANAGVVFWLVALLVAGLAHRLLPASTWLLVHLLLLGAVTNAIVVWSAHFSDALLKSGPLTHPRGGRGARLWPLNTRGGRAARLWPLNTRGGRAARLWLLNAGVAAVVAGMTTDQWYAVLSGGSVIGAVVLWHGIGLAVRMRRSLPSRFKPTVRYYLVAAAFLPLGAAAGILLAHRVDYARLVIAHVAVNLLGWVGMSVLGTLVTLWATMLRTRIADGAERAAARALWILAGAVAETTVAAMVAPPPVAAIGVAAYLTGLGVAAVPLVKEALTKPPASYATYSVAAGLGWLVVCLGWLGVVVVVSPDWHHVAAHLGVLVVPFAAGFAAEVLLGALSYLIPVVAGGGPTATRAATAEFDRGAGWRVSLVSVGVAVWVAPVPRLVALAGAGAVLVALASFLPLLARALWVSARERRPPPPGPRRAFPQRMEG